MTNKHTQFTCELITAHSGFDGDTCLVHGRGGAIPGGGEGGNPLVVITEQPLLLSGSDVFSGLRSVKSNDGGNTWTAPQNEPNLVRRADEVDASEGGGEEIVVCDFTPKYHSITGKLLGIGHTARYTDNRLSPRPRKREPAYAVYDQEKGEWDDWHILDIDGEGSSDGKYFSAGAGSAQRVDLPDGDILLPIYFHNRDEDIAGEPYKSAVVRCGFDGINMSVKDVGVPLELPIKRGLYEPSLACCNGKYFLTMRNDDKGCVAVCDDGLNFDKPVEWRFDDGTELGNYNTQQHWIAREDELYLVYTRRGLDNDHVFRHRAPLVIAQVDIEKLCIIRSTEKIIVPQRGARLGNFGVVEISDNEFWVTVNEWMQPVGCEKYGSDNSLFVSKLKWK